VNRIHAAFFGERDDPVNIQIRLDGTFPRADLIGLVCLKAVQSETVFLRIDADGAESQFGGRAEDANSDFAAVRREKLLNRFGFLHSGSDQSATRNPTLFHVRGRTQQQFIRFSGKTKFIGGRGVPVSAGLE
jgi:hypothetical protein